MSKQNETKHEQPAVKTHERKDGSTWYEIFRSTNENRARNTGDSHETHEHATVLFEDETGRTTEATVDKIGKGWIRVTWCANTDHAIEYKLHDRTWRHPGEQSETLKRYRDSYEDSVTSSGRPSKHNGDPVAQALEAKDAEFVMALAEHLCGLKPGTLEDRYSHLNNGQRRMNAGNRIRSAFKKGEITEADIRNAKIAVN